MPLPKSCFPIPSAHSHLESSHHWKAEPFFSLSFQPLYMHHPTLLLTPTVLLELFASQAVTGSLWHTTVHPRLHSIIYASFKCTSLRPLVTPCPLPRSLPGEGLLLGPTVPLAPKHQASIRTFSSPTERAVALPRSFPSLPSPKPSHPRNICQGFANNHFFICWGKSHLCI